MGKNDVVASLQAPAAHSDQDFAMDRALGRVNFRLTYGKTEPRDFTVDCLWGPDIPNAFRDGMAPGSWMSGDYPDFDDPDVTEDDWLAHFAQMAVNEAVHEALEWFQVDGKPWLNPHGEHEREIYRLVGDLCAAFAKLAAQSPPSSVDEGNPDR